MISPLASACCAGGTRFKPRCTANSVIGWPLTVAALPLGSTAGLAGAGVFPTSCAARGKQEIASVNTIPQQPRMDFLLVPENGSKAKPGQETPPESGGNCSDGTDLRRGE